MNLLSNNRTAISRGLSIGIVVILILAAVVAIYYVTLPGPSSSTTAPPTTTTTPPTTTTTTPPTTSTSPTSTATTGAIPSTMVYEWAETYANLDPDITYFSADYNVVQNVYEPLVYYNYTCSTCVVPWLAQSVQGNAGGTAYTFTLRSGIKFADGEPLNSTSVFFGLNRALVYDGSTGTGHGTQASWEDQQMVNATLCTFCSGSAQKYGAAYADAWLAKNFVQITGPLTFTVNVKIPNAAFLFIMTQPLNDPLPPTYVMQKDLALWSQSSNGYTLPNPTLSGSLTNQIKQYLEDLSATCNSGVTPSGCARSYLDDSPDGSLASTGPYILTKNDATNNIQTIQANPNYWGGPNKVFPKITTITFKFVPSQTTREIDLKSAASSGQAMAIDLETTNLYDVANRGQWLNNNKLESDVSGVTLYGPYPGLSLSFDPFNTNVTSATTGQFYKFQPFADLRFRTAFADAVNMTTEWNSVGNRIGQVAPNVIPPGLPPEGSYNASIKPAYSFNPDLAAQLLLQAMQNPITSFNFVNGTKAPAGVFDNHFGCATLSSGKCSNPITQSITLIFPTGDTFDEAVFNDMAGVIDNISTTYNMGLTVSVEPLPIGTELVEGTFSSPSHLYMYALGWFDDYPWVLDFTLNMLTFPGSYEGSMGMNYPSANALYQSSVTASQQNNIPLLIHYSNQLLEFANSHVLYLWTVTGANYVTMTSNVQGFYWNTNASPAANGGVGPEFFASLY